MRLDFREKGRVKIDMEDYIEEMLDDAPIQLKASETAMTPATGNLFAAGYGKKLDTEKSEAYHRNVAKGLFVSKRT